MSDCLDCLVTAYKQKKDIVEEVIDEVLGKDDGRGYRFCH